LHTPAEEAFGATKMYFSSEQRVRAREQHPHFRTAFLGKEKAAKLEQLLWPHTSHWHHFDIKHGDSFPPPLPSQEYF